MGSGKITSAIDRIADRVSLFETEGARTDFLRHLIEVVSEQTGADMAAAFVHDEATGELVLRAGLENGRLWAGEESPDTEMPRRFALSGNEIGRAFSERRVIRIRYDESDAEHPYRSKLLIPIVRGPMETGVLVLARRDGHGFDEEDEAGLTAAASRFADRLTAGSELIGAGTKVRPVAAQWSVHGIPASQGRAYGTALPFWTDVESLALQAVSSGDPEAELAVFETALAAAGRQLVALQDSASSTDREMVAMIFSAHQLMLNDESFTGKIRARIMDGHPAVQSVQAVVAEYAELFSGLSEVRLAEKAQDVRDLGYRLISNIVGGSTEAFSYRGRVAIARHIYPSDLYRLAVEGVEGLVLRGSGVTAHISILARSLGLPVIITDSNEILGISSGTPVLLDAAEGILYVNPDGDLVGRYSSQRGKSDAMSVVGVAAEAAAGGRGKTADGTTVQVLANVNILKDAIEATAFGAEGIGLYRSEFPFILKNDYLSEEQQFRIYRSIVATQAGKPVILRTADIGGDKLLQGRGDTESNPFLGVRGIRFSLANREMFREQLRAMLRAGTDADLGIMVPMVSGVEEVLEAKKEIALAVDTLRELGVPHNPSPRVGAMVELPSAAMAVRDLASETDFLSIGTNDLTMYLLAVDRTNEKLHHLYRSHHPTVLRVFAAIARFSGPKRAELSVCGDVASDPVLLPFFVGIGIRKLSVTPSKVESVKRRLAAFTLDEMRAIAHELLAVKRLTEMEQYLDRFDRLHPGRLEGRGELISSM